MHEHPDPGRGRARTCAGLGRAAEPALRPADRRPRQCRHRRRMRDVEPRHPRRRGSGQLLRRQRRGFRHHRARGAARRRGRRCHPRRRHPDLRPLGRRGPARSLERLHQGDLRRLRGADRRIRPLHRGWPCARLHPPSGRADRGQGRRARRRQGGHRGRDAGGGARRGRRRCSPAPSAQPGPRW